MTNIIDKVICCKPCYKKLPRPLINVSGEVFENCFNLEFRETKKGEDISTLILTGDDRIVLTMKKLTFKEIQEVVLLVYNMVERNQ